MKDKNYFLNVMSQNLGSLPLVTQCHTSSTPFAPLTCDVIYGCPLSRKYDDKCYYKIIFS